MLLHMGQKKVEPEVDPWNYSAIIQNQLSPSTSRWRSFITPMWWHLLWSFSWVWTWSKGCCSFSPQTPETNKSLFVLPCIRTDAAVPLLLQICDHSKLQLCGKYIKTWENVLLCMVFGTFCFERRLVSSIICTYLILSSIYSGSTCNPKHSSSFCKTWGHSQPVPLPQSQQNSDTHIALPSRNQVSLSGGTRSDIAGQGDRPELLSGLSVPGDQPSSLMRGSSDIIPWKSAVQWALETGAHNHSWCHVHTFLPSKSSHIILQQVLMQTTTHR